MSERPLEVLRRTLAARPAVRLAVHFGSTARGRGRPGSDLDVGVLLDEDGGTTLWEIEKALAAAIRQPIDLVDLRRAPPLLRFQIARDGRALVERREGDWKRFKYHAVRDWWDWEPTARRLHRRAVERLREKIHGPA